MVPVYLNCIEKSSVKILLSIRSRTRMEHCEGELMMTEL